MLRSGVSSSAASFSQSGQVGVITLLLMAVLLTVGLSTAINTSQDVTLSQQEAESTRVFNAAESGVEEALSTYSGGDASGTIDTITDVDVDFTLTEVTNLETRLFEGVSVAIDVTGVAAGNGLDIEWSRESDCSLENPASLLVSVITATNEVRYYPIGACDRGGGFPVAAPLPPGDYRRQYTLALQNDDTLVRIKPLYNDTHISVNGSGWTLPVQGVRVRSEAQSELGNEARAVEVNQSLPTAPSVMDYALVSGTSIVK